MKQLTTAFLLLMLVSGCATNGPVSSVGSCAGIGAVRYSQATIDAMTDEEVRDNLDRNDAAERLGCAIPNK